MSWTTTSASGTTWTRFKRAFLIGLGHIKLGGRRLGGSKTTKIAAPVSSWTKSAALIVLGLAPGAWAIDPLCTVTPNFSIYRCPDQSEDWISSYWNIVDTLDGLGANLTSAGVLKSSTVFNGSGITNLNASNLASGTVGDARLSGNVALLNSTQTFSAADTFSSSFTVQSAGRDIILSTNSATNSLRINGQTGQLTLASQFTVNVATTVLSSSSAITSTSYSVCFAGSTVTVTVPYQAHVQLAFNANLTSGQDGNNFISRMLRNGVAIGTEMQQSGQGATHANSYTHLFTDLNVPAGSTSYCIQGKVNGGSFDMTAANQFTAVVFP